MKSCKAVFSPATFPPKIQYRQEALHALLRVLMGLGDDAVETHFLNSLTAALLWAQAREANVTESYSLAALRQHSRGLSATLCCLPVVNCSLEGGRKDVDACQPLTFSENSLKLRR